MPKCDYNGGGDNSSSDWTYELMSMGDDGGEVEIKEVLGWFNQKSVSRIEFGPKDMIPIAEEEAPFAMPANGDLPTVIG